MINVNAELSCRIVLLDFRHRGCTASGCALVPGWSCGLSDPQTIRQDAKNAVAIQLGGTLTPYPRVHCNPNSAAATFFRFGVKILDLPFGHRRTAPSMSMGCRPAFLDTLGHMYLHSSKRLFQSQSILHALTSYFWARRRVIVIHTELESCHDKYSLLGHDKLYEVIYVRAKCIQNPNCPYCP